MMLGGDDGVPFLDDDVVDVVCDYGIIVVVVAFIVSSTVSLCDIDLE